MKDMQQLTTTYFIPHFLLASNLYIVKGMIKVSHFVLLLNTKLKITSFHQFLIALRKIGALPEKDFPYGDPEIRFLKRFSIFHYMQNQPQPLFYYPYADMAFKEFDNMPVRFKLPHESDISN